MDQITDLARLEPFLRALPLRVMDDHVGLGGQKAGAVARRDDLVDLARLQGNGLFGQHMLAGRKRLQRPFDMQVVGQRDIDRVNRRVGQQRLIAGMHHKGRAKGAEALGLCRVAGGQGRKFCPFGGMDRGGHMLTREILQRPARPI